MNKIENPYPDKYGFRLQNDCWQEGFDVAIKWLFEPCREHYSRKVKVILMHKDCPRCMKELKQEIKRRKGNE